MSFFNRIKFIVYHCNRAFLSRLKKEPYLSMDKQLLHYTVFSRMVVVYGTILVYNILNESSFFTNFKNFIIKTIGFKNYYLGLIIAITIALLVIYSIFVVILSLFLPEKYKEYLNK